MFRLRPGERPIVLDGGLATELEARGADLSDELWSARLLADDPGSILRAHLAYFRAGAQIAITASYQASFDAYARRGIDRAAAHHLLRRSVDLARDAREQLADDGRQRWVAASVGPYGASRADGSEYVGRYGLTAAQLADFHRPRLAALAEAGPDLLAIETIPDLDEAAVLVELLDEFDLPAWISFTATGLSTRAGQPLPEAFAVAAASDRVVAVGVNCCSPADVAGALELAHATGKPVLAYPNSGEVWSANNRSWSGSPGLPPELARSWIDSGVALIGGCCRTGPSDIAALARLVA
jgi:homocysteine S-methyltransferase